MNPSPASPLSSITRDPWWWDLGDLRPAYYPFNRSPSLLRDSYLSPVKRRYLWTKHPIRPFGWCYYFWFIHPPQQTLLRTLLLFRWHTLRLLNITTLVSSFLGKKFVRVGLLCNFLYLYLLTQKVIFQHNPNLPDHNIAVLAQFSIHQSQKHYFIYHVHS